MGTGNKKKHEQRKFIIRKNRQKNKDDEKDE